MNKEKLRSLLLRPDATIKQAMQKLNETAEKILFLTDEHSRLLGTVTDGDIRRAIIDGMKFNDSIEKVMHKDPTVVVLNQTDTEENIRQLIVNNKFEQIPVLDNEGVIVDVILWTDILKGSTPVRPKSFSPNQVVIMAGGKGTRLDPFTRIFPKPLIPLGNKAVIEIIMEKFYQYGFHKFLYTLNYKKEYLKLFLKEKDFPYVIDWVEEDDFLGTAGGLALLKDRITESFFMINCDSVLEIDFGKVLAWHKEHRAAMTIVGCHSEIRIPFGVLELSNGSLKRILEKPVNDFIINTGAYVMEPHVISYITEGSCMDMNELISAVLDQEKVSVYPIYGGWFDIGQWEEYNRSIEKLRE